MGKTILSKYLEVSTPNGARMRCRLCDLPLYSAPLSPGLDVDQMNALLTHFLIEHEVTREDLTEDVRVAFEKGMAETRRQSGLR